MAGKASDAMGIVLTLLCSVLALEPVTIYFDDGKCFMSSKRTDFELNHKIP